MCFFCGWLGGGGGWATHSSAQVLHLTLFRDNFWRCLVGHMKHQGSNWVQPHTILILSQALGLLTYLLTHT